MFTTFGCAHSNDNNNLTPPNRGRSRTGRRDEALVAIEEAVRVFRRLAAANSAAHELDLARSLNNLSIRLAGTGRRDDALAASEEAVTVFRRLAAANSAAHEPDLAQSLNSLSNRLEETGRRDEAEQVRREVEQLRAQAPTE